FKRFPTIKGSDEDVYKELIKTTRENYKGEVKKLNSLFYQDVDTIESNTKELYPLIKVFFDTVLKFREEFTVLKNEKNILDFSDVEGLMVNLLCENRDGEIRYTDISEEISDMFDAIMVDEFQDVNDVQDLIFKAVSRDKNNIFVVGDVKQSIYGFRQAKPDIFIGYKDLYNTYDKNLNNYPAKIILDRNFRSRLEITEACNFIFSTLMSKDVGGLEYNDEEKLVCGATYSESSGSNVEFMLINSSNINEEKNETELILEASKVAEKIYKIIFEEKMQIKDGDNTRTVKYGDIAILLRSPKGNTRRAVTFVNTLNQYAIPTVSQEKNNFFDAPEIKVMLNVLRVIDNPVQDIPLLSVLMSPMFSFTADDIASLRADNRRSPIYLAVKNSSDKKCKDFIAFLDKMRTLSVVTTVDRLIGIILDLTGFDCVAMSSVKFNEKNLYLLEDYARSYAENGYKTLTAFINYIDRVKERGMFLQSVGDVADSSINAVKVMSIHSSKGLEFPVCFICGTSTEFNLRDASYDLVINSESGIGIRVKKDILKFDTVERKALSLMQEAAMISEEMRVLYVALTRAKERLIITATNKEPEKYLQTLESKIPTYPISPFVVKSFKSYSDWLFACVLANPSCDIRTNIEPDYTNYIEGSKPWNVEIINEKIASNIQRESLGKAKTYEKLEPDTDFLNKFIDRINFKYKNHPLSTLPQKVSASELSHKDNRIFNKVLRKPSFMTETKADGTEKGTAFHNFMERCNLLKAKENCKFEAEKLKENGYLTSRQIELLDYEKLENFLNSELIERVLNSEKFYREYQFTVRINAEEYNSELSADFKEEKIVMQGAVDLVFVENGGIVIVDYKTDRVKEIDDLGRMYQKQVDLYKSALEETTALPVKEVIIYSLHLNKSLKINT
ncbi:MAG: UvrD-helicase domain-containing protein, partial [Ruminococcus sp.]|nr:UvrD-helicase domain-containing protein [Ruminococcus sp.]